MKRFKDGRSFLKGRQIHSCQNKENRTIWPDFYPMDEYEDEQAHLASYSDVLDDKKDIKDVKDGENEKHIGATDLLHRAGNLVVDQAALFQPLSLQ